MALVAGIDVGGTNLRIALFNSSGKIVVRSKEEAGDSRAAADIVSRLALSLKELEKKEGLVKAVGVGLPGIVTPQEGIVFAPPHFPQWHNVSFRKMLEEALSLPVDIDNDANMAARGEKEKGAGRGFKNFLMVTLGTGIGGAIVIDGRVFQGDLGFTGEFGHMVIEAEGVPCACGSHGCFEAYASGTGLVRMTEQMAADEEFPGSSDLSRLVTGTPAGQIAYHLRQAALQGNEAARAVYARFGYYLGIGIASLVNVTGIHNIILGGGISQGNDLFLEEAKREMRARTYRKLADLIEIRPAQLGDDAGLVGASFCALEKSAIAPS